MTKNFPKGILDFNVVFYGQQVRVRYKYIRSPMWSSYEDLYIKDGKVASIQDSIITKTVQVSGITNNGWTQNMTLVRPNGLGFSLNKPVNTVKPFYFYSNLTKEDNIREMYFTAYEEVKYIPQLYLIEDKVTKPNWKIDDKNTKKIAGYTCTKATAYFRGSNITAYFAKDLPYSTGPYKFFGLPGLILDVRVDGQDFKIWNAEEVTVDDKAVIDYKPNPKGKKEIKMEDFVKMNDEAQKKEDQEVLKNLPAGTKMETNYRAGVEKKYEWEM